MSNALPADVTRYSHVQRVAAPASASAFVSTPKEPVPGAEPQCLSQQDWDYLLAERTGIIHESGCTEARAHALALGDTVRTHGPRPQEAL